MVTINHHTPVTSQQLITGSWNKKLEQVCDIFLFQLPVIKLDKQAFGFFSYDGSETLKL